MPSSSITKRNLRAISSSTDNAIVRWDSTTGRLVQNSALLVGDSGMMTWSAAGEAITAGSYQIGRNADATNRMQFNVPTGAMFEFSINDVNQFFMSGSGILTSLQFGNGTSSNNAAFTLTSNGTVFTRNIADSQPAMTITQSNAGSTGNILNLHNSAGAAFSVLQTGGITWGQDTTIVSANHEIRRTASGININVPTGDTILMGINGGTTFQVGDGSIDYTATANERFTVTAPNHTGTSGAVVINIGLGADSVSGFYVNGDLTGDRESTRLYDALLRNTAGGLSAGKLNFSYYTEIEGNAADAADSIYIGYRAEAFTSNGGSAMAIGYSVGASFTYALAADSGSLLGVDNSTWGITALNTGGTNRAGYGITFTADDGSDSGATARDGGSFNFKLGNAANAGTDGRFNIIEAGAGTDALTFWHDGSNANFSTNAGRHRFAQSINSAQGADVASANDMVLGSDGNVFEITGTTTINHIANTNWVDGAMVTLVFNESVTVTHGSATSGANIIIMLAGAANFSATANDTLTLVLSTTTAGSQAWREVARSVI